MAIGPDRVQPAVYEDAAGGGDPADTGTFGNSDPIDPQEDAIESCGVYFQDASNRDETTYIARDGNDLIFTDINAGTAITLTELLQTLVGNEIWVDDVNGDDASAVVGRFDKPYLTIDAALTAASSGDAVIVRPGAYPEDGLVLNTGVTLISEAGPAVTSITGAGATGTRISVNAGSTLNGFTITVPTDALPAVICGYASGVASVNYVTFTGAGGSGIGLQLSGAGKVICAEIRMGAGSGCDAMIEGTDGILALDACHMPGGIGAINAGIRLSGGCRGQIIHPNMGSPTITTGVHVLDAIFIGIGVNIFNCTNAIRISDNTADVRVTSGLLEAGTYNLLVDSGLTGAGGVARLQVQMEPKFSIPSTWIDSDHAWTFFTKSDLTADASLQLWGADYVVGHPEKGNSASAGEGTSYSTNNKVLTTDNTATATDNGGSFIDVSVAAESKSSSTFSFQDVDAGCSILWTTKREDSDGEKLKYWGCEIDQTIGADLAGGSFVWEIQTAPNVWAEVDVLASSFADQYAYANNIFLRSDSIEVIRIGIDGDTTWPDTLIDGTLGHWMRVRIASGISTAPVFERLRLLPSYAIVNEKGQQGAQGLAQWVSQLFGVGNVWGEIAGGGTKDATVAVGSGGTPTGWNQKIKKGDLNSNGDSVSFQFQIPDAICTAYPLYFELFYSTDGGSPITTGPDVILSVLVLGVGGVTIADAGGAIIPVARGVTSAEVFTSKAATAITVTGATGAITDTQQVMRFGPYSIADYYEGDAVIIRLELDDDGAPAQDLTLWTLATEGVRFSQGGRLAPGVSTAWANVMSVGLDGVDERLFSSPAGNAPIYDRLDSFSVSLWMKSSATGFGCMIGKQLATGTFTGWGIFQNPTVAGEFYVAMFNTLGSNTQAVRTTGGGWNDGAWHHVCLTYDGSSTAAGIKIAVDGADETVSVDSDTLSASILTSEAMSFGSRGSTAPNAFYNGRLDEVSMFNIELSAAQITELYNSGVPNNVLTHSAVANLDAYYRLGDGSDGVGSSPVVSDLSGNGYGLDEANLEAGDFAADVP